MSSAPDSVHAERFDQIPCPDLEDARDQEGAVKVWPLWDDWPAVLIPPSLESTKRAGVASW
jgi:hypothetical protein